MKVKVKETCRGLFNVELKDFLIGVLEERLTDKFSSLLVGHLSENLVEADLISEKGNLNKLEIVIFITDKYRDNVDDVLDLIEKCSITIYQDKIKLKMSEKLKLLLTPLILPGSILAIVYIALTDRTSIGHVFKRYNTWQLVDEKEGRVSTKSRNLVRNFNVIFYLIMIGLILLL